VSGGSSLEDMTEKKEKKNKKDFPSSWLIDPTCQPIITHVVRKHTGGSDKPSGKLHWKLSSSDLQQRYRITIDSEHLKINRVRMSPLQSMFR